MLIRSGRPGIRLEASANTTEKYQDATSSVDDQDQREQDTDNLSSDVMETDTTGAGMETIEGVPTDISCQEGTLSSVVKQVVNSFYDDRTVDLLEFAISVCPVSCTDSCSPWAPRSGCYCDSICQENGDCCLEKYTRCEDEPVFSTFNDTELPSSVTFANLTEREQSQAKLQFHAKQWFEKQPINPLSTCEELHTNIDSRKWVSIIAECPKDASPALEMYRSRCEDPSLIHDILVRFSLITTSPPSNVARAALFKNVYCANCNGIFRNDPMVGVRPPSFNCSTYSAEAETILKRQGYDEFVRFLSTYCIPVYYWSSLSSLECLPGISVVDNCNQTLKSEVSHFQDLQAACRAYRSEVLSTAGPTTFPVAYKNPHCAMCNGYPSLDSLVCLNKVTYNNLNITPPSTGNINGIFPTFFFRSRPGSLGYNVLFDGRLVCLAGQALSVHEGSCFDLACPDGQVLLEGICSSINWQFAPNTLNTPDMMDRYTLIYQFENTTGVVAAAPFFFAHLFELVDKPGPVINISVDVRCSLLQDVRKVHGIPLENQSNTDALSFPVCVLIELRNSGSLNISTLKLIEQTFRPIAVPLDTRKPNRAQLADLMAKDGFSSDEYSTINVHTHIHMLNHRSWGLQDNLCKGSKQVTLSEDQGLILIEETNSSRPITALSIYSTDSAIILSLDNYPTLLGWKPVPVPVRYLRPSILSSFCQPEVMICDKVMFQKHDVVFKDDGTITVNGYKVAIQMGQFAEVEDSVAVCKTAVAHPTPSNSSVHSEKEIQLLLCSCFLIAILLMLA